jgi:hypothetical protein
VPVTADFAAMPEPESRIRDAFDSPGLTGAGEVEIAPNPGRRFTENMDRISYPQYGQAVTVMREIKRTLDPRGVLNHGKLF